MKTGILVGYFINRDEAREAFMELGRRGYHRVSWVGKNTGGEVKVGDPFPKRRIFGAAVSFILFGCLAVIISMILQWVDLLTVGFPSILIPGVVGGVIGTLLSVVWIQRSRFGVERMDY